MTRHAAFYLPGAQMTEGVAARYDLILTYRRPKVVRDGTVVLGNLCVGDFWDPIPNDLHPHAAAWSRWCQRNAVYARDERAERIPGWGAGRWAVDLSLIAPWGGGIALALNAARNAGLDGLALDDLAMRPYEMSGHPPVTPRNGLATWAVHAQEIATAIDNLVGEHSLNGGKTFYTPTAMMDSFDVIKLEDRYVTESGKATLKDWLEGREGWSPGILAMEAAGHDVVWDCFVPTRFTKAEVDAYAETRLATMMLTNRGRLCLHGNDETGPEGYRGPWARTPIWTPAHDLVERLGGPLGPATRMGNGGYWRQYTRGRVYVNPTDAPIQQNVGRTKLVLAPGTGRILEG